MEIEKTTATKVEVNFTVIDGDWTYMDSLVFSAEDFNKTTEKTLNNQIEQKYSEWKTALETPASPKETVEEKLERLEKQKEKLEVEILALKEQ